MKKLLKSAGYWWVIELTFWKGDIAVTLKVRNLRVGGGSSKDADLGCLPTHYSGSSIKGLLRKSARRVANSINTENYEEELFGSPNIEGKVQVIVLNSAGEKRIRYGIKIDLRLLSASHGHLFSYEYTTIERLNFVLKPVFRLSVEEAKFLYYTLNFLRYESIGGFGSRGIGLIEDLEIQREFVEFVEGLL